MTLRELINLIPFDGHYAMIFVDNYDINAKTQFVSRKFVGNFYKGDFASLDKVSTILDLEVMEIDPWRGLRITLKDYVIY